MSALQDAPIIMRRYARSEISGTMDGWNEIMPTIRAEIDKGHSTVENLACRSGCNHCCKLKVEALPHEVAEVIDHIRFSDKFDRLQRGVILDRLRYIVERTEGMNADAYLAENIPCPFLSDNGLCLAYSVRPVACRAFGSTNVEVCAQAIPDDGSTFRVLPDSLSRLSATSGLFFTPFLKACLDWWGGFGIEAQVEPSEVEAVVKIQELIEAGAIRRAS